MAAPATIDDFWGTHVDSRLDEHAAKGPPWLADLRRAAAERYKFHGFPGPRSEDWRFTNVSGIAGTTYAPATPVPTSQEAAARWALPDTHRLCFVNGHPAPSLSTALELPPGVVVTSLARALEDHAETMQAWLGRLASAERNAFVALNTALHDDGAVVLLPPGAGVETPIHLLFVSSGGTTPTVSFPRVLVVAGEDSRASLVETYAGSGSYLSCPVTEISLGAGAVIDHYRLQEESLDATHIGLQQLFQERSSTFTSHAFALGGGLVRTDVDAVLDGERAHATLNGLYVLGGTQHVDTSLRVRHAQPHCTSHELYKGILDDRSRSVFTGRIVVDEHAQKTDAKQSNRNLLLSAGALARSNPQLEIFADDVRCTHGSTVGRLDEDAIFYLRSRGIGREQAIGLLTSSFAGEIIDGIRVDAVRRHVVEALGDRLPNAAAMWEEA